MHIFKLIEVRVLYNIARHVKVVLDLLIDLWVVDEIDDVRVGLFWGDDQEHCFAIHIFGIL